MNKNKKEVKEEVKPEVSKEEVDNYLKLYLDEVKKVSIEMGCDLKAKITQDGPVLVPELTDVTKIKKDELKTS